MLKENFIPFHSLDQHTDLYFLLSDKGNILDANDSALKILNISPNQLFKKNFLELLHTASILKTEYALTQCINTNIKTEITAKLKYPLYRNIDVQIIFTSFVMDKSKWIKNILVEARDITESKKKEIDLLRFYYVAENTVNPLQITDISGKMVFVNPAFEKASGYLKEELLGKNPSVFSSNKHSKKFWGNMWEAISNGKVWVGEVENTKKNGEPFFTQLMISPILDNEGKVFGYFGIHRDLTEKKNLEKQLLHTQKMESIGTLAAGVAHEVGNPLTSISALVQIIQRSTNDNFITEKLELVKKQINRISKIIRDLVDFSRPSNYELKLTNINENLSEAIEIVRVGKKAKNINFIKEFDENLTQMPLIADQMQQVFINILINAVDSISEKQTSLSESFQGEIEIKTEKDDDYLIIGFQDNGSGISNDNKSKIFEPFFTTKKEGKGTGLGLWVSYGIIKSFQGEIKVESKLNDGTKFIIYLPIYPAQ